MKIYLGLLNCDWWYTVTLVYSQVLSVPAGDGGLHVQQAPRVGYSGLSEFLCKQFDPALIST